MSETSELYPTAPVRAQLGALDLGSNSFHLIVAQEAGERIQVIDKHKEMVRLAAGLDDNNQLSAEACARALECLGRFAQRLRSLEPENVRVVGTNTLRKADSPDFLAQAEAVLGHRIEIISGREEARLIFMGVCHDLGSTDAKRLIVDIGGGSTEMIIGQRFTPLQLESLYTGCVSLTKTFFGDGKITDKRMRQAISHVMVELEPVMARYLTTGWNVAVGSSGTINAISDIVARNFDAPSIQPEHLQKLRESLCKAGEIDKIQLDGLADERKAVFPGGLAILSAIFEALGVESMGTSQAALREGLIFDLIGRQHQADARDRTVSEVMRRFRVDEAQARNVRETAIALLAQVAPVWNLQHRHNRNLLSWAADLMEVGMDISHSGYHKHGQYLLDNLDMPGFSRADQHAVAALVRSHRRKLSKDLFNGDAARLMKLAVLLRLAALLHRNRSYAALPHITATASDQGIELTCDDQWLEQHPLTLLDLDNETSYLAAVDFKLRVSHA